MEEHPVAATHPHRREDDPFPWNVVVMGMGEPLLNYEATVAALRVLMDPEGFGVPAAQAHALDRRHPARARAARARAACGRTSRSASTRPTPACAARSCRSRRSTRIDDVVDAALRYPIPRGGLRDLRVRPARRRQRHARPTRASSRGCCGGTRVKVNLIPLNPAPEIPFQAPRPRRSTRSAALLAEAGVTVSVRRPRGRDILAACGQLHLKKAAAAAAAAPAP